MRFTIFFLFLVFPFHNVFSMFNRVEGIEDAQIKRVVVSPLTQKVIYIASKNSLFKSRDSGQTFEKISVFKEEEIQHLFFDSYLADTLYLATSRHIFKITNDVKKIFSSQDEAIILTAAKVKGIIYAGTTNGVYFASEDIFNWAKLKNLKNDVAIYSIAATQDKTYFASNKGVYVLEGKDKVERVFVARNSEDDEETGLIANIIKVDLFDENKIWAGTNQGIFVSSDKGDSWNKVYAEGIDRLYINSLAQRKNDPLNVYLATTKGFLKADFNRKISQNISGGLSSSKINWIEFDSNGRIYLATANGVFVSKNASSESLGETSGLEELLENEPSIEEIQQAALRYNEVGADKIKKWRRGLKTRALFPQVSLDYDKTVTTALGATYDRVQVGPQDWGVNLKWDVGDLVWNTYEDDIDTRSRLNTQMRLDILDEINRVYFERLRLKREIAVSSLTGEEMFQKKLRLEELDAIIDGYTGGYFSKKLKEAFGQR